VIVHEIGQINGLLAFMIFEGTSILFLGGLKYNSSLSLYMYLNISHSMLEYQDMNRLLLV
jgi:hypothetical protein